MLSQKHRFHRRNHVMSVYRHGALSRGDGFGVHVKTHPSQKQVKVAVVVSKKVDKRAVTRNALRRRVFEAVRGVLDTLPETMSLVISVYTTDLLERPFPELQSQLIQQIHRAHEKHSLQKD